MLIILFYFIYINMKYNIRQIVKRKNKKTRKQQRGGGWFRNSNRIQPSAVITAESEAAREEAARAEAVMARLAVVRARARLAAVKAKAEANRVAATAVAAATKASRKIQARVRGKQTRRKFINNSCPICLEPMIHNVCSTSPCNHKFHSYCIRRSLDATGGTCPLCRAVVTSIIAE
jgi:hypothetical protein